jgi:hypothetical protein
MGQFLKTIFLYSSDPADVVSNCLVFSEIRIAIQFNLRTGFVVNEVCGEILALLLFQLKRNFKYLVLNPSRTSRSGEEGRNRAGSRVLLIQKGSNWAAKKVEESGGMRSKPDSKIPKEKISAFE